MESSGLCMILNPIMYSLQRNDDGIVHFKLGICVTETRQNVQQMDRRESVNGILDEKHSDSH